MESTSTAASATIDNSDVCCKRNSNKRREKQENLRATENRRIEEVDDEYKYNENKK